MAKQILLAIVLMGAGWTLVGLGQSPAQATKSTLYDFDIRDLKSPDPSGADALVQTRTAALASFLGSAEQARLGTRIVMNEYGLPKLYRRDGHTLTGASAGKPSDIAKTFLQSQAQIFSLSNAEIDRLRLAMEDITDNARFLAYNQTLNGIDVFNAQIKFTMTRAGEIVQVATGDIVTGLNISTTPRLSTAEAVKSAFTAAGATLTGELSSAPAINGKAAFVNPRGANYSPITAELNILPMSAASARLAYRVFIEVDSKGWFEILVDANSGELLFRHNLYVNAAQARVWAESPMKDTRTLFTFPDSSTASPNGWIAAAGTITTGNNVDAYVDTNGNDIPDSTTDPNLQNGRAFSATQLFDFPFGDGTVQMDPRLFQPAAITNIFYYVNIAHDYYYGLGFNETAGNFQTSNFDRGGVGNDAVLAEAQYGGFTSNAAFAPTPEGIAPKIRMGLFTRSTSSRLDDLDSDYDGEVVLHEYGHGVSNRLVGAKTSTSCLSRIQSGAMGEGWSDYFASSFFNNPVEGAYISQNSVKGIRRYSYEGYPLNYEDIGSGSSGYEVHDDGEIWAGTLWDLRKSLGAAKTDRLVMDGLKSTPCNPSMTDARDAILSADMATNAGANRTAIWTIFAKHGLGSSAVGVDGTSSSGTRYDASYDLPPDLQPVRGPAITSNPLSLHPGAGDIYTYAIVASNPSAGTLAYSLLDGPFGMTIDSNGNVNWTAAFVSPRIKISVTDGKGGKVVHGFLQPLFTTLVDGRTISISGNTNTSGYGAINVPAGVPVLQIRLRGGTGDPDMFVRNPDGALSYSARDGSSETISFANPKAGAWQLQVQGYQTYSGVSLTANFITPTPISANTSFPNVSADLSSETFYKINVPAGVSTLSINTGGGTGDVDIFLRKDFPAVCQPSLSVLASCLADRTSANDGTAESISVANPSAGDWYLDLAGYEAYSGVKLDIATGAPPITLNSTGAAATTTLGTPATVTVGYATATINSGVAPYATAVFSYSQNGFVVSEAGVPATPPLQSARVFIDYRTGVTSGNGKIDIYTGLAIANRSASVAASLTFTLRDRSGQTIATGHGTLAANAHQAKFIHELKDIAPDFTLPANFPTATLYGSLQIDSSQPVSVLGLRLTYNQRGDTLLTSTSVADLSKPLNSSVFYFPQLADGGGYTTSVILSNTSGAAESGTISFAGDSGTPVSVRPVGGTAGPSFSYSIPAAGVFVMQTDGSPAAVSIGSIKITPDSGTSAPVGIGVFSYTPAGILVTETGIPSAAPTTHARLYVDKSGGHDTGIALSNPGASTVSITMQISSKDGTSAGVAPATVNLSGNGHRAAYVGELVSGLPSGFTGVVDLISSSPFIPLTLRGLTNGRGDALLTTFPAADVTTPAPSPIVFPHIADGGGYTTQFIFISATGAATVTVDFVGDDGNPLAITRNP